MINQGHVGALGKQAEEAGCAVISDLAPHNIKRE